MRSNSCNYFMYIASLLILLKIYFIRTKERQKERKKNSENDKGTPIHYVLRL